MSLVFRHRNPSPYLHVSAPRSPLKIVAAFVAGAIVAGILLHRPADTSKFLRPADGLTSGFSAENQAARGAARAQEPALSASGVSDDADATGKTVADEKETSAAADARSGTQPGEAGAAVNVPRRQKSRAARGHRQVLRVLELPDGRRITVYQDTAAGSPSPGPDYPPQRGFSAPFRLNAPILTR